MVRIYFGLADNHWSARGVELETWVNCKIIFFGTSDQNCTGRAQRVALRDHI